MAINRQILIVWIIGFWTLISFGLNYLLIKKGWGIEGVALGTTGVNVLAGCVFLGFTLSHFFKAWKQKMEVILELFLPFTLVGLFLVLTDYLWPATGLLNKDFGTIILKGIFLIILTSPFLWRCKKKMATFGASTEKK